MTFIPDLPTILAFSVACFVLTITPGPDMTLFLGRTLAGGRAAGIAAYAGASTGSLIHTTLAAVGLSALIAASPEAFLVLKIFGAGYLIFLAVQVLFIPTLGASPGHRLFGMRIVRVDGGWSGVWRPLVRTLLLALIIPAVIWDGDHRGLHDKIAGTVLVRG